MMIATTERGTEDAHGAVQTDYVHTGPGTIAGRYMRLFWHPVRRAEDLAPGRAIPIRIMGEDFTLYRGESGAPHVVAFRCAHRGTQLSTGWVEGDDLRCFYHGWKYDSSGRCVEQPAEPEPFCQKIHIRSYPTQEYLGLIFAYLGEGEAPSLPRYPQMEGEGVRDAGANVVRCNFFNSRDNDTVHGYFVHRRPGNDWREWGGSVPLISAEEDDCGMVDRTSRPGGGNSVSYKGMPNWSLRARRYRETEPDVPGYVSIGWRVPIDDQSHWQIDTDIVQVTGEAAQRYVEKRDAKPVGPNAGELGELVLAGQFRIEDIVAQHPDVHLVKLQDAVSQCGQDRIADRDHEHLGRSDAAVILYRQIWMRELHALADGKPVKQWKPPTGIPR